MIEVRGLSKRFGEVQALHDVSFKVNKGQVVGFLGANGAGKTTTMDILCGCLGPDGGSARIAGYDITDDPEEAKRRLGYLPDEPPIYNDMRVEDYINYAAKLNKVPRDKLKGRVDDTVERLSLGDVRRRVIGNLSKGYRQRVAFAQAIVHAPEVLILDEPTEGLDPNQIIQIRQLVRNLAGEHTIILSSHILSEVQNTCDEIIIINQGRVIEQGTYDQVIAGGQGVARYQLHVKNDPQKLCLELQSLEGIQNVALTDGAQSCIEFGVSSGEEVIDLVLMKAVEGKHGVRELVAKTKSLEDIFLQLTR